MKRLIFCMAVFIGFPLAHSFGQECVVFFNSGDTLSTKVIGNSTNSLMVTGKSIRWNEIYAMKFINSTDTSLMKSKYGKYTEVLFDQNLDEVGKKVLSEGKWNLDQRDTNFEILIDLVRVPDRLEFIVGIYEAVANVRYNEGVATVGNIRWGGSISINGYGGSVNVTLEESIFSKSGKLKPRWENEMKNAFTFAIKRSLSYYQ